MKKILIIEDDRIILETTAEYLKEEGYEVLRAIDGEDGINKASELLPDLILCDISMPKFDGYQVFSKLLTIPSLARIPFIFLTARTEMQDIRFGMQLGADDYITKPIDFKHLLKSIKVRLEKYDRTIRTSELYYRTLFELAIDAILLIRPPSGEIVDANLACQTLLGYSRNELLNLTVRDIFCTPSKKDNGVQEDANVLTACTTRHEAYWRKSSGDCIPVLVSGKELAVTGDAFVLLIAHDITDLKNKEAELFFSKERYREIVDLTNDWIWEINDKWQYTYVSNKVKDITGYSPEEMIGKTPFDFVPAAQRDRVKEMLRGYVHDYKPLSNIETWVIHKKGHLVCFETSALPVFDSSGKYLGYRGADRDITIRKTVEQQLILARDKAEESDRLKSSILANISHELRTPLNGILGFAEILSAELKDTPYISMAENIHTSGYRLMTTLNALITLSQLEAGKLTPSTKQVNLLELISRLVQSMEPQIREKDLKISFESVPDIEILTDDNLLRSILRQLLDNALKFTESGSISFETVPFKDQDGEWLIIHLSDTGIGIEKDYFNLIFQEFRQVSEGFGRKYQGSGIGLTICKKIIDLLQGRITLTSQPGEGSTFSVWIPQEGITSVQFPGKPLSRQEDATSKAMLPGDNLPLVLLVEDNNVNRDLTSYFLKHVCQLHFAMDGLTALELARRNTYAAILMDINLGSGITGIEVTHSIRKLEGYQNIPIIAVTGYTMVDDQKKLLEEGCTHYIAKPFDKTTLLELMHRVLNP